MYENTILSCRRHNFVQAAVVQAVVRLRHKMSDIRAIKLLTDEGVPTRVIERVLSPSGYRRGLIYTRLPKPDVSLGIGWPLLSQGSVDQRLAALWLHHSSLIQNNEK